MRFRPTPTPGSILGECPIAAIAIASVLLCVPGCAPVLKTTGRNAVGAGLGATSYAGVDQAAVAPDLVALPRTNGIRASYSRRVKSESRLWLGPEAVVAYIPEAKLSTGRSDYPEGVSRTYVGLLMKLHGYPGAGDGAFGNFGLGVGAGLAYGRFAESERLINGTKGTQRRVDGAFGPVLNFGLDYRITDHVILRADAYFFLFEPDLSFPWPDRVDDKVVAGGGLVFTF
jgi:hypothetical protein